MATGEQQQQAQPAPPVQPIQQPPLDPLARLTQLEQQLQEVTRRNTLLEGALVEQRQTVLEARAQLSAPRQFSETVVDTRLIGKPKGFPGRDEDWPAWSLVIRAYAGAISSKLLSLLNRVEVMEDLCLNVSLGSEEERGLSVQWYYVLTMLLEGKATEKVNLAPAGEGLLLWQTLVRDYESKAAPRKTGLLQHVLGFQFDSDDLLNDLERFEGKIKLYEAVKDFPLDDDIKVGVVIRNIGAKYPEMSKKPRRCASNSGQS